MSCTWNSSMDGKENEKLLKCWTALFSDFFGAKIQIFVKAQTSTFRCEQKFWKGASEFAKRFWNIVQKKLLRSASVTRLNPKKRALKLKNGQDWNLCEFWYEKKRIRERKRGVKRRSELGWSLFWKVSEIRPTLEENYCLQFV